MSEQLIRAAMGEPGDSDTLALIGKASAKMDELATALTESKDSDTARYNAVKAELKEVSEGLSILQAKHEAEVREAEHKATIEQVAELRKMASGLHAPSKAASLFGRDDSVTGYKPGDFIYALTMSRSTDYDEQKVGKALLAEISWDRVVGDGKGSLTRFTGDGSTKATLGATDATGGFIIPNALVETIIKPGRYRPGVGQLVNHVRNVSTYQVEQPVRTAAPSRALVAPWGDTKENRSLAYGGYTATLYTVAAIYDLGKQFVKYSRGAAEQDVLEELGHAFDLGESYYILQGSGTSEPYGLQPALGIVFGAYTSSFTASATTLAGSVATAIATAGSALAGRNQAPNGAIMSATSYWLMLAQGTDTAGFWFAGQRGGSPEGINPNTLISPFGIPVYPENQITGSDDLIVGNFNALRVYHGDSFRVDTSDEAGERWDKNLIGFRGESEIGLDARSSVVSGAFQFIADIVP